MEYIKIIQTLTILHIFKNTAKLLFLATTYGKGWIKAESCFFFFVLSLSGGKKITSWWITSVQDMCGCENNKTSNTSKRALSGFGHINHCGGYMLLPPDTGASIKTAPIFSAAAAISLDTAGSIVLESMSREPFFTFLYRKR